MDFNVIKNVTEMAMNKPSLGQRIIAVYQNVLLLFIPSTPYPSKSRIKCTGLKSSGDLLRQFLHQNTQYAQLCRRKV